MMSQSMKAVLLVFATLLATTKGFVVPSVQPSMTRQVLGGRDVSCRASFSTSGMWTSGLNFGKGSFSFYKGFENFMSPFAPKDKEEFPELFTLPKGVYEVSLPKPLGIVFEEISESATRKGVVVVDLVEGGNAERLTNIQKGDLLVGMTAVKIVGAKWERRLIPARKFDFDTVVGAIMSNDAKWGCQDVVFMLERPTEADSTKTDEWLEFFEPPFDNPWKQQQ